MPWGVHFCRAEGQAEPPELELSLPAGVVGWLLMEQGWVSSVLKLLAAQESPSLPTRITLTGLMVCT